MADSTTTSSSSSSSGGSTSAGSVAKDPAYNPDSKDFPLSAEERIDRDRKENPQLERVLDELQVVKDNLPVDSEDGDKLHKKLDSAMDAVRANFVTRSDKDIREQAEREEELKQPQA